MTGIRLPASCHQDIDVIGGRCRSFPSELVRRSLIEKFKLSDSFLTWDAVPSSQSVRARMLSLLPDRFPDGTVSWQVVDDLFAHVLDRVLAEPRSVPIPA